MRHLPLVVLVVFAALTSLPSTAATAPGDCADRSLVANIFGTADPSGAKALFPQEQNPQNKACIFICDSWGFSTSMKRGTGANCTASQNSLSSQAGSEASSIGPGLCNGAGAAFGYCGFNLITTVSCHWDFVLGTYVTDGYGDIKCKDWC